MDADSEGLLMSSDPEGGIPQNAAAPAATADDLATLPFLENDVNDERNQHAELERNMDAFLQALTAGQAPLDDVDSMPDQCDKSVSLSAAKAAKLATVAHHLGTLALLLASVYSWPHTLCKSITYARALQRRRFPLEPWTRILWSTLIGQPTIPHHQARRPSTFLALPTEILFRITDHLHAEDLAQLAATCRRCRALVDSNAVWASLVQRDFATRATRVFPKSMTRRKPSAKYQYRVLADSAAVVGPCACVRDHSRHGTACCYTAFACEKRTAAPWYRRWRVTWRETHGGWPAVLATIRAHARTHLYQVLLTPAKLAGVVFAAPLLFIAWLRLRLMTAHGVWGHLARDLYLSSWAILTDAAVVLDAHWLLVTTPMCVLALALRDADRAVGWMWQYRHALVKSAVRIVVVVGVLGSAASVLAMGVQLFAVHGMLPVSGPWARVMVNAVVPGEF